MVIFSSLYLGRNTQQSTNAIKAQGQVEGVDFTLLDDNGDGHLDQIILNRESTSGQPMTRDKFFHAAPELLEQIEQSYPAVIQASIDRISEKALAVSQNTDSPPVASDGTMDYAAWVRSTYGVMATYKASTTDDRFVCQQISIDGNLSEGLPTIILSSNYVLATDEAKLLFRMFDQSSE